jgi:hypothetical protein
MRFRIVAMLVSRLLTVVSQHFLARGAEFITVLLEASKHGKVPPDPARTGKTPAR